jgi:hypothetical protein
MNMPLAVKVICEATASQVFKEIEAGKWKP